MTGNPTKARMRRIVLVLTLTSLLIVFPVTPAPAADTTSSAAGAVTQTVQVDGDHSTVTSTDVPSLDEQTSVEVAPDGSAALAEGASFGFKDFSRLNKGTDRAYNGSYYGYRYQMSGHDAFMVIVTGGLAIVYIPPETMEPLGISLDDPTFQKDFITTLGAIDSSTSHGGQVLSTIQPDYLFTSADTVAVGDYTYRFGVEVEEDYYYGTVTLAGSEQGSQGALYAESGTLSAAADTQIVGKPTGLAALGSFLSALDWRPLWVSLKTTGVALVFIFVLGLLAAWGTVHASDRSKGIMDTFFTIPMVLPPTVVGFLLLLLFGQATGIGRWFIAHGINIVFTWQAAVIACAVVGFPLLYRTARGAFENLDPTMLDAARTLGWTEKRIFVQLMLPLAWPSIAAGTVLAFARAMGEFGATLFFAGNFAGITQTIPIAIYFDWMAGDTDVAIFWVIVVILISFLVILFINLYSSRTQRYRAGGVRKRRGHGADDGTGDKPEVRGGVRPETGTHGADDPREAGRA